MRQGVSLELKKAFRTKGFYIALVVGLLISLYHTVWIYRYAYAPNNAEYEEVAEAGEMDKEYGYWYEIGVLDGWLGTELQSPAISYSICCCHFWQCFHMEASCFPNGTMGMPVR